MCKTSNTTLYISVTPSLSPTTQFPITPAHRSLSTTARVPFLDLQPFPPLGTPFFFLPHSLIPFHPILLPPIPHFTPHFTYQIPYLHPFVWSLSINAIAVAAGFLMGKVGTIIKHILPGAELDKLGAERQHLLKQGS